MFLNLNSEQLRLDAAKLLGQPYARRFGEIFNSITLVTFVGLIIALFTALIFHSKV